MIWWEPKFGKREAQKVLAEHIELMSQSSLLALLAGGAPSMRSDAHAASTSEEAQLPGYLPTVCSQSRPTPTPL